MWRTAPPSAFCFQLATFTPVIDAYVDASDPTTNFGTLTQLRTDGDLKGKGFDLESTHLHTCDRLSRLTLAVALLYTCLMDIGRKIIKNGLRFWVDRAERRDLSLFQIGFRSVDRRLTSGLPIAFDCAIGCDRKLSGS